MFRVFAVVFIVTVLFIPGCAVSPAGVVDLPGETPAGNPLLEPFETPFNLPLFDLIEAEHFLPAFFEAIRMHDAEIEVITENPAEPGFENTIAALEYSGLLLEAVTNIFFALLQSVNSDQMEEIAEEVEPLLAEHDDNIILNSDLFERIEAVYLARDELNLGEEESRLVEETYRHFVENGAALPGEDRERFREINSELALLEFQFYQNVLADTAGYSLIVEAADDLEGLPPSVIATAAEAAGAKGYEEAWLFTLQGPVIMPLLTNADNRELRSEANEAYIMRGANDNEYNNEEILNRVVALRLEKANLLGHDNYAYHALQGSMAENLETVQSFMQDLWQAALPVAREEAETLQKVVYSDGNDFVLAYWDWRYYAEKVRREQYDLSSEEISEYFELNTVLEGLFATIERLFGLRFKERSDLPLYHPDTAAYEVSEADGSHVGIIYLDLFSRPEKQSGAWMGFLRNQYIDAQGDFVHPVVTVCCNFSPPLGDEPVLLDHDEVLTVYHELGHALHGLLSKVTYPYFSGTRVPRDFVELPSQIMEHWARNPEALRLTARHYRSGEPIPEALLEKMESAARFNNGFEMIEMLASALLDFEYHTIGNYSPIEVGQFEKDLKERYNMPEAIYFRHGSTHFMHSVSLGYTAAYYSYLWSGVLDADAFEAFVETGDIFDPETAQRFRREILERGGSRDAMDMYIAFRGREPEMEAMLSRRGMLR